MEIPPLVLPEGIDSSSFGALVPHLVEYRFFRCLGLAIHYRQVQTVAKLCLPLHHRHLIRSKWRQYLSRSPLSESCVIGSIKLVKLFHKYVGIDPFDRIVQADSPLHIAIRYGHLDIVKYLLDTAKVDPNEPVPSTGARPLHSSARYSRAEILCYLIMKGADYSLETNNGQTIVHLAASFSCLKILEIVWELGQDNRWMFYHRDVMGRDALYLASVNGDVEVLQFLIQNVFILHPHMYLLPRDQQIRIEKEMLVPVILNACGQGHVDLLHYLGCLFHKLSQLLGHREANLAMFKSVMNGQWSVMQTLLGWIDPDSSLMSAVFRVAASKPHLDILKYLYRVSQVNLLLPDPKGVTALHLATSTLDLKTIKYLVLRVKAPVSARTQNGDSVLHFAVRSRVQVSMQRKLEVIQFLVDVGGCSVEAMNNDGETVLGMVRGSVEMDRHLAMCLETYFMTKQREQSFRNEQLGTFGKFSKEEMHFYVFHFYKCKYEQLSKDVSHEMYVEAAHDVPIRTNRRFPERSQRDIMLMMWELTDNSGDLRALYESIKSSDPNEESHRSPESKEQGSPKKHKVHHFA